MGKDILNSFVEQGFLDESVLETSFDPFYEPTWFDGGTSDERADVMDCCKQFSMVDEFAFAW